MSTEILAAIETNRLIGEPPYAADHRDYGYKLTQDSRKISLDNSWLILVAVNIYVKIVISVKQDISSLVKNFLFWLLDYFFLQSLISEEVLYEKTLLLDLFLLPVSLVHPNSCGSSAKGRAGWESNRLSCR